MATWSTSARMDWSWLAWIGSVGVGIAGLYTAYMNRQRPETDNAKVVADASVTLIAPYRDEVAHLRTENIELRAQIALLTAQVAQLQRQVAELSAGIGVLVVQIENAGMQPLWKPKADAKQP
jgi:hypothetical protein